MDEFAGAPDRYDDAGILKSGSVFRKLNILENIGVSVLLEMHLACSDHSESPNKKHKL